MTHLPPHRLPAKYQWANLIRYYRRKAFEARRAGDDLLLAQYEDFLTYSYERLETLLEQGGQVSLFTMDEIVTKLVNYTNVLLRIDAFCITLDKQGEIVRVPNHTTPSIVLPVEFGSVTITPEALQ